MSIPMRWRCWPMRWLYCTTAVSAAAPIRRALLALYHDAPEILTGDLPTPVKYDNPAIREAYRQVEDIASDRLLSLLPEELRPDYQPLLKDEEKIGRSAFWSKRRTSCRP